MKKLMVVGMVFLAGVAIAGPNQKTGKDGIARSARTLEERIKTTAPVAEGVLRARPTFNSCGICFGAKKAVAGLTLQYREKAQEPGFWAKLFGAKAPAWTTVKDIPHFDETGDYRGSILGLKEDTEYEVRVCQSESALKTADFRTWASEVPIAKTIMLDEKTAFPVKVSDKGTAAGWIRYTTRPGLVLDNRTKDALTFLVEGAEYVLFDDMTIKGSGAKYVFSLVGSREVRIRNCDISGWGRVGTPRFDMYGRHHETDKPPKGYGINFDGAIDIARGCSCVVVERCFVHDPRGRANSWFYSHPAGPEAVTMRRPDHSTVIRYNDFIGSDIHRWNDAVESEGNFDLDGGFNRDADVYGNFMIFCNDDNIELDGGQQNVRCFDNRFEAALCGVSIQGCMVSPVYVYNNGFYSMCEEFGKGGQTIKTGGGAHGEEATAYINDNIFWGAGSGITWMELLRAHQMNNLFCGSQSILKRERSPHSTSEGDRFKVDLKEEDLPTTLPVRPAGFLLDRARFSGIRVAKGIASPATVSVTAKGGATETKFRIAKCEVFDWFEVSPAEGVIPANGELTFTVTFRPERMNDRHDYRGAFIVRTPEGLSRGVSIYAETDFVPPYHAEKKGDVAVYAPEAKEGQFMKTTKKNPVTFTFDVAKEGRYYFMIHSKGWGKFAVAVDGEKQGVSKQQNRDYPTWTMLTPGRDFGNMCRHYDLKPGQHTVTLTPDKGSPEFDGAVLTDNPWSFEPR